MVVSLSPQSQEVKTLTFSAPTELTTILNPRAKFAKLGSRSGTIPLRPTTSPRREVNNLLRESPSMR